jgi:NAD(P)-dependent dehydrogenase (short-subunit alcohol dehydrogenase family)
VAGTALITGGSGALGTAVTAAFLEAGWRTVITSVRSHAPLESETGRRAEVVQADLLDEAQAARAVAEAAGEPSAPLRAVVNLVGGFAAGPRVADTPVEAFEAQFEINVRPTFLVTRAALPRLLEQAGGAIVCVSSRAALEPFPGAAGYAAAKASVIAFGKAVAAEYGADGIRSNVILPGIIDTQANRAAQPDADHSRWASPHAIAETIRFLASHASRSLNGVALPV